MSDRAEDRDRRYSGWLEEILIALDDGRTEDAASVINNDVPDAELRSFTFWLAIHINRDLSVLKDQVREKTLQAIAHGDEIASRDRLSPN